MAARSRPYPDVVYEEKLGHPQSKVAGVDEVGRGCLAGPVYAAAVVLPNELDPGNWRGCKKRWPWLKEVTDSKLIAAEARERLSVEIQGWALAFAIGSASVEEIDRINIHHASHLAMVRAVQGVLKLAVAPEALLVDGKFIPKDFAVVCPGAKSVAVIKGDQKVVSIACASIIAKVARDQLMVQLDGEYPGYGFASHKGYSTPQHKEALVRLGPCILHRRSFEPVRIQLGGSEVGAEAMAEGAAVPLPA